MNSKSESGRNLIALRPRITRLCPDCGVEFTAYKEALSCKKCANKRRQQRHQLKLKEATKMENYNFKTLKQYAFSARQVLGIEMATSTDIYSVELGEEITIIKGEWEDGGGMFYAAKLGEELIDWADTYKDSLIDANNAIVADVLVVEGYGEQSGRQFWRLPKSIKSQVLKLAKGGKDERL